VIHLHLLLQGPFWALLGKLPGSDARAIER
jgi:hypothetical protein